MRIQTGAGEENKMVKIQKKNQIIAVNSGALPTWPVFRAPESIFVPPYLSVVMYAATTPLSTYIHFDNMYCF
jgi:hypothetical protein